ncbi:MAG: SseB family protein [Hespellia sp.]|nr:SseB family protein [Hespellia sp.]
MKVVDKEQLQVTIPQQEERFTMLIEDAFPLLSEGTVITGVLCHGILKEKGTFYLLGGDGKQQIVRADMIELLTATGHRKTLRVDGIERIGILIHEELQMTVEEGMLATNVEVNTGDINKPFENIRLKGYLAARIHSEMEEVESWIARELDVARFLVLVQFEKQPENQEDGTAVVTEDTRMQCPFLTNTNGESFQPVFTDWVELRRWVGSEPDVQTIIMTKEDALAMVARNPELKGVVVNPFSDNYMF